MPDQSQPRRPARALLAAALVAVVLVLMRSFPTMWYEGYHFDSDQAVVGLMAKHLAEGRAFPLFFYGQHYMLGVQAWLAAPFFLLGGPTVFMLHVPVLIINATVAVMLVVLLNRELDLGWAPAFLAALPFIVPPAVTSDHLLQMLGASVEPLLYVLLLWVLRQRAVLFGLVLMVGFLHREFTIFALPALGVAMALDGSLFSRATTQRALTALATAVIVWTIVDTLKTHIDVFGPSSGPPESGPLSLQMAALTSRMSLDAAGVAARARSLFVDCLSDLFGVRANALREHSINSTVVTGSAGIGLLLFVAAAFVSFRVVALAPRAKADWRGAPFCVYLALVALQSAAAYTTASEVQPGAPGLIRYVLLMLLLPVALAAWYFRHETARVFRGAVAAVLVIWAAAGLVDTARVVREYATVRPPNKARTLADFLVARGVRYARADYWDAYITDFLARERVVVASTWKVRVREYQRVVDAHRAEAAEIVRQPCVGGVSIEAWCVRGLSRE